ncbi:hypothetical protein [Akkermansia sp.]|nr:hypothetical protein [Akkermansia sp.]
MENGQNLVVEGCYIPFDWKKDFTPACREQIRYVCLIFSEDYIQRHYHDIMDHANAIEQRMDEASCTRESLLRENRDNLEKCRQHGCDYLLIEESYNMAGRRLCGNGMLRCHRSHAAAEGVNS